MNDKDKLLLAAMGLTAVLVETGLEAIFQPQKHRAQRKRRAANRKRHAAPRQAAAPRPAPKKAAPKPPPKPRPKPGPYASVNREGLTRREQYEKKGYWSAYIGGGFVTSSKDPDDWEHPYTK